MLNSSTLNSKPLNSQGGEGFVDWEALAPIERQTVYVLDIGSLRLPISSAQATRRKEGQSFMQVVVPAGDQYIDALTAEQGSTMLLRSGYRYADGTLSPLEVIGAVGFQQLRRDEGGSSDSLTLSGYAFRPVFNTLARELKGVRHRSTDTAGRRRTRCDIDFFLSPGHLAIDSDGVGFTVGVIQYFINATSEAMEVIQDG